MHAYLWWIYSIGLIALLLYAPRKVYKAERGDLESAFGAIFFCFIWPILAAMTLCMGLFVVVCWCTIPEFRKEHPLQLPWKT